MIGRTLRRALRKAGSLLTRWSEAMEDQPRYPNLLGDRDIEWGWVLAHLPSGPGQALDFGNGGSPLGLAAAMRGFQVTAVDLQKIEWPYVHSDLRFVQGDVLRADTLSDRYDLILNCSTVEHVGLEGRYDVREARADGDLEAMRRLRQRMKPGALMLLTIPVGKDAVFAPLCRVYGEQRLGTLLEGYVIENEEYWIKDPHNRWICAERETALRIETYAGTWNPLRNYYGLGCFVLKTSS